METPDTVFWLCHLTLFSVVPRAMCDVRLRALQGHCVKLKNHSRVWEWSELLGILRGAKYNDLQKANRKNWGSDSRPALRSAQRMPWVTLGLWILISSWAVDRATSFSSRDQVFSFMHSMLSLTRSLWWTSTAPAEVRSGLILVFYFEKKIIDLPGGQIDSPH